MLPLLLLSFLLPQVMKHTVYESVIHDRGKTIGTTIMLATSPTTVTGWIQKHDFVQIETGSVTDNGYSFTAAGNHYEINTKTGRINYSGPDGSGDQRLNRMEPMEGRVYKIREETDEGRELTLQTDHGEQFMVVEEPPAVWKNNGPPIAKFSLDRLEEVLGKTLTIWRVRTGGIYTLEVIEEPAGMDILPKLIKEKKKKK